MVEVATEAMRPSGHVFMYFPENRGWSHQLIRVIGEAHNGGGSFGEIDRAASKMIVGDLESWHEEWKLMAEHVKGLGDQSVARGSNVSAAKAYFRASNYYRMADFYLERNDPRELPTYEKHVKIFQKAGELTYPKIESLSIPYEGHELHSYFIESKNAKKGARSPLVIIFGGADATCEEAYFSTAVDVLSYGFHALVMDGPGQGYTLRFEKLYARFDYEKAVAAAMDYILKEKEDIVDPSNIAIIGRSMGGYYASRTAAMEKRVRSAVVFDAIYDITSDVYDFFPGVRRAIDWDLGATSEEDAREKLVKFNLSGVAGKISCPILIIHGSEDYVTSPKAAEKLYSEIGSSDKKLKWYKAGHGVSAYSAEATSFMLDWLKEKFV